jgi:hypothetical protein
MCVCMHACASVFCGWFWVEVWGVLVDVPVCVCACVCVFAHLRVYVYIRCACVMS